MNKILIPDIPARLFHWTFAVVSKTAKALLAASAQTAFAESARAGAVFDHPQDGTDYDKFEWDSFTNPGGSRFFRLAHP